MHLRLPAFLRENPSTGLFALLCTAGSGSGQTFLVMLDAAAAPGTIIGSLAFATVLAIALAQWAVWRSC